VGISRQRPHKILWELLGITYPRRTEPGATDAPNLCKHVPVRGQVRDGKPRGRVGLEPHKVIHSSELPWEEILQHKEKEGYKRESPNKRRRMAQNWERLPLGPKEKTSPPSGNRHEGKNNHHTGKKRGDKGWRDQDDGPRGIVRPGPGEATAKGIEGRLYVAL